MSKNNGTSFTFQTVVKFTITAEEAASVLSVEDYGKSVSHWLSHHSPEYEPDGDSYSTTAMRSALGIFLAEKKIDETRQLCMSCACR